MKYNPEIHHRRSIRLKGYNYSQPGAYFITICTYQRQCWFGEIRNAQMKFNQIGKIVVQEWLRSEKIRPNFKLDEWIVMPNHLHGIVWIVESELGSQFNNKDVCNQGVCNMGVCNTPLRGKLQRRGNSLSSFIGGFKAAVTRPINQWRDHN